MAQSVTMMVLSTSCRRGVGKMSQGLGSMRGERAMGATDEMALSVNDYLRKNIRTVPNWPVAGVQFRDITPLLQNPRVFRVLIDAFVHRYMSPAMRPDVVAGLDARGFILGAVVAYELNVGFVPVRKKGKLPFTTVEETYE